MPSLDRDALDTVHAHQTSHAVQAAAFTLVTKVFPDPMASQSAITFGVESTNSRY